MSRPKRRKTIPRLIKAEVFVRQRGRCACGCGERLLNINVGQFDHDPALKLRDWDEKVQDTIPPANDPDFIFHKTVTCHRKKTSHPRGPHTSIDSDQHKIAKERRLIRGNQLSRNPVAGSRNSRWKVRLTSGGRKVERRTA